MTEQTKSKGTVRALLHKELVLATPAPFYLFALLGLLIMIPHYPAIVSVAYACLALFNITSYRKANRDAEFTAGLPVKRNDSVTAFALFCVIFELIMLAVAGACAAVADYVFSPYGNTAGIDPNLAFFGISFAALGVYNFVFLTGFYKTGYKCGLPALFGTLAFALVYGISEAIVQAVPAVKAVMDTLSADGLWVRAIVLAAGAVVFAVLNFVAVKISQKRFDKVSL